MNSRTWIVLLAFLGWSIVSWYWYTCKIKNQCGNVTRTEVPAEAAAPVPEKKPEVKVEYGPLTYALSNQQALTTDKFDGYISKILGQGADGKVLVVSGPYYQSEKAPQGFENMGLARASSVRDLIANKTNGREIELSSHLLTGTLAEGKRMEETRFRWVTRNENVQETLDGALIYFPYKSDEKISNPEIEAYLNRLANTLKAKGGTVKVVGHTDDKGGEAYNKKLGMERAVAIKGILVNKGVSASSIVASSEGELSPIASNDTDAGRQKNRRTEIIIKN